LTVSTIISRIESEIRDRRSSFLSSENSSIINHRRGDWALGGFTLTPGFLQVDVGHGRKALIIFVPIPLLAQWHKSQQR
jgi:hypothetical protein